MKFIFRASFFLFIFFLISCKKDKKDTIGPVITCNSPTSAQHFNMFDTITVNARVTDNEHLAYINVTLTDLNHTPLQASHPIPIQSADFVFNIKYILTQFHLQTGNYYMQITADDGYNTVSFYQPISITESPTLLWGVCTVLKNQPQKINQIQFDSSGALIPISTINLSQVYNGMKYGSYNQQLYVNGKGNMPFQAFYLQPGAANQLAYSASATVNQLDYTCLYTDGNKPYVGFYNSDINSFDNSGAYSTSYRLTGPNNYYPYLFTKTSNYAVGVYKNKISTNPDEMVSFTSFGASFNTLSMPGRNFKVVAMFEKGTDSLCVLGNDSLNQAEGYIYSIPNGGSTKLQGIPSGKMLSATKVNSNCIAFSVGSSTNLYYYSNPYNYISVPVSAQKLVYQPKLNQLTIASSTSSSGVLAFYTVNPTSLTLVRWPISCGDSIVDFEVITNK